MKLQDRQSAFQIRRVHHHLPVEAAGPQQRAIQHFRPVGRRQDDDAEVGLEAVHPDEQLIQGLLAFVIHRPHVNAALAANRVQFVNEHDAGRLGFGFLEQVADASGAHAYKHLHKIAAANQKERDLRFPGNGAGQKGFAGSGRADQQDSLGNRRSQSFVTVRVFQKRHHFLQFVLRFIAARHVVESHPGILVRHHFGFARTESS